MATPLDDSPWTEDEKNACLAVRDVLIKEKGLTAAQVGEIELIVITLNSKCRTDEAVQKFMTYHENLLGEYGLGEIWAEKSSMDNRARPQ